MVLKCRFMIPSSVFLSLISRLILTDKYAAPNKYRSHGNRHKHPSIQYSNNCVSFYSDNWNLGIDITTPSDLCSTFWVQSSSAFVAFMSVPWAIPRWPPHSSSLCSAMEDSSLAVGFQGSAVSVLWSLLGTGVALGWLWELSGRWHERDALVALGRLSVLRGSSGEALLWWLLGRPVRKLESWAI